MYQIKNCPTNFGDSKTLSYIFLNETHIKTGNTRHFVMGELVQEINGLAICKYEKDAGYYLFYCNQDWEIITDTYHNSIEDAKKQAEFEFINSIQSWVDI